MGIAGQEVADARGPGENAGADSPHARRKPWNAALAARGRGRPTANAHASGGGGGG